MEKTLVSKFVEDFKKVTNETTKQAMVKKHVTSHYAPILHKSNVLNIMMDGCVKQGKSGKFVDMLASKLNFAGAILVLYTDLEVDKTTNADGKEVANIWGSYDLLKESGVWGMILDEIGEDVTELLFVQDQILGTWHNENCSTAAYISDLVEKVSMIFSTGLGKEFGSITEMFNELPAEEKKNFFSMIKGGLK